METLLVQVPLVSAAWDRTSSGGGRKGKAAQRTYGGGGEGGQEEEEGLLDRPLWSYVSNRITRLLREGLGDRCVLARPLCGVSGEAGEDFRGKRDVRHLLFSKPGYTGRQSSLSLFLSCFEVRVLHICLVCRAMHTYPHNKLITLFEMVQQKPVFM